uniref:Uncharacterized protein n=1 Tax=Anguilla anguilla TaxID=7936 RepID=A0A0E9XAW1_ANGAN
MPSVSWSGVKHMGIGLWSSGNVSSGMMTYASLSGSLTDEFGFGGMRSADCTGPNSASCKVC